MWWFFSLIMCASYTANLAAFLTMERMGPTIESAEDLAKQTTIKYGCVSGGATCSFFRDSNFSTYHRMWTQMQAAEPSVYENSNKEGVKRVKTSKRLYAFLMENTGIEYEMERDCDLRQVGGWLDSKGYGIAMPVNSPYRTAISGAVLKMQEDGKLHKLKEKWWKKMHGGGKCSALKQSGEETAAELGIDNVGGIFVVLVGGIALAFIIAIAEFLWNVRKVAVTQHIGVREALDKELRFAMHFSVSKKRVKTTTSSSGSSLEPVTDAGDNKTQ